MKDIHNCSLLPYNTFGIDVCADRFIEYSSEKELLKVIPLIAGQRYLHIGGGSNLLFTNHFHGVILHSAIKGIETVDDTPVYRYIRVGAAEMWDDVVAFSVEQGYSGLENLSLIPGEVGASAVQNIGAYGVEVKDVIDKVEAIDLQTGDKRVFDVEECCYGYRQSIFKQELRDKYAVTYVTYRLDKAFTPHLDYGNIRRELADVAEVTPAVVRNAIIRIRQSKLPDPKVQGNAGSFFKNPVVGRDVFEHIFSEYPSMPYYEVDGGVKIPAGWLIEQCGWKGKTMGRAGVNPLQALVLVNLGGASGQEVLQLCDTICEDVYQKFGIRISPEVNII